MTILTVNDTELYVEDTGPGETGETIVFSHGLLWNTGLFRHQVAALRTRYRCIAYDHRGQGRSADSPLRAIDMDLLTDDAIALVVQTGAAPVHFCGLSMGGFVAMRLARRRPDLLRSLILMATTADPERPENVGRYRRLNLAARWLGHRLVVDRVMPILFSRSFLDDPERADERADVRAMMIRNRRSVWRAVNGVIGRDGYQHELPRIDTPTMIVVGDDDVATPPELAERMRAAIPGAVLAQIAGAGHSPTIERPDLVTDAVARFLDSLRPTA